ETGRPTGHTVHQVRTGHQSRDCQGARPPNSRQAARARRRGDRMMRRREFVALLGGAAAAWPLAVRAQQPAMPGIGFLHVTSLESAADRLRAFRQGLKEIGFVEGENVAFEHRTAEDRLDRLPELASQLLHRPLAMIAATSIGAASASNAATTTIPVV